MLETATELKVLVVGGGGREHALAWKLTQSPRVNQVYVAPGNAGSAREPGVENVPIDALDLDGLIKFAQTQAIDLTIIGPEAPLVAGIVDRFQAAGLACFGPTSGPAQLEGSKAFSKDFFARHQIPTASYQVFTEVQPALDYLATQPLPIVIKADGLAAGKGVTIAETEDQAQATVRDMLSGQAFGEAGHRVVIEEFLSGEEASFIVMVDGEHVLPMASSQDHKARDDGDQGPNTGGMGAYSPAPVVDEAMHEKIMQQVIMPTVAGLKAEGMPYQGFLYAGVMVDQQGNPKVLEYNCRFGDPETQPIMLRLQSDLAELCLLALDGRLNEANIQWDKRSALGVVIAAGGYPLDYRKGDEIEALPEDQDDLKVFHAGTQIVDAKVVTQGGRVLCVAALGDGIAEAQQKAYAGVKQVKFQQAYYRSDIGYRAINRGK